jgi:P27 family predicted phage terminase small subunit
MPTNLKLLHGERRSERLNKREPKGGGAPVMPTDMSAGAKVVWRRVMTAYGQNRVITDADRDTLRIYCEAVDRYITAQKLYQDTGPLVRGARRGELVKNPVHQIVRDNAVLARAMARELGLTPSARAGLQLPDAGADPLDAWLTKGRA